MDRLTNFVLSHMRLVVGAWLAITIVAFASIGPAINALSTAFDLPGREGFDTNQRIEQIYGNGGPNVPSPVVPVVTLPPGTTVDSPGVRDDLAGAFDAIAKELPAARIASYASTGDRTFVSADGRTTFGYVFAPVAAGFTGATPGIDGVDKALAGRTVAGQPVLTSGLEVLRTGTQGGGDGPSLLVEVLFGGVGALVVLALVFGSVLALVPLLMAVVAIPTIYLLVWGLTTLTDVSVIVQFLVGLIGLGVAIDYALLIVIRWREERVGGAENREAIRISMRHAGTAVVFSGAAVGIGLLALVALPIPFLRSVGLGGMLIPLVSVLVAITLLPVILAKLGPRLDKGGLRRAMNRAERGKVTRWTHWGRFVTARRGLVTVAALAILAALFIPAFSLAPGDPRADSLAAAGPARQGLDALTSSGIGAGAMMPFDALVTGDGAQATKVADAARGVEDIHGAVVPQGPAWQRDNTAIVEVVPTPDGSTPAAADALDRVRAVAANTGATVSVGGYSAQTADSVSAIYGNLPLLLGLIAIVTFIVLARVFRSLLLPLKAVVFNLISIGAIWGFVTLFWQDGYGSEQLFNVTSTGAITSWVPFMVFTFLYGLSMDYEVFILSRIREEYDRTGNTDEAIVRGLAGTGRLVTAAALILFLAFVALASTPGTEIKILATALAVGILLDATVVRALLLPAMVSLFGRWNWYLPRWAARLLFVAPSAARRERPFVTPDPGAAPVLPRTPDPAAE